MTRAGSLLVGMALVLVTSAPVFPQAGGSIGSSAAVTLGSGPHKGRYAFSPTEACVLAKFSDKPMGMSVVMSSSDSSLSIDVPNLDEKHANQIQIVLVVAEVREGASRKGTSSTTYEIDTRPDSSLEPFKRAERANKGMTGKATTTLMTQGNQTLLSFSGETAMGVKITGEVTCRRM